MAKNNSKPEKLVDPKDIEKVITWRIYYDKRSGKPLGPVMGTASLVCVCAPDERLPGIGLNDKGESQIDIGKTEDQGMLPPHIEIRKAVMVILKTKGES